eukprot:696607-Rhodomonas_salina.2
MAPPGSSDPAALGWYSQKKTFKRKYVCVRPKYTGKKLEGIKRQIHRLTTEQLEEERERERKEREEAASKEADEGKRRVMEEEAEKAARLAELKAKAEALRQEKSTLFGMLKQALVEDAKRKAREERLERQRKEEEEKKEKEAAVQAARELAGGYHGFPDRMAAGGAASADPSLYPGRPGLGQPGHVPAHPLCDAHY